MPHPAKLPRAAQLQIRLGCSLIFGDGLKWRINRDSITGAEHRIAALVFEGTVIIINLNFTTGMKRTHTRTTRKVSQPSRPRYSICVPQPVRPRIVTRRMNLTAPDKCDNPMPANSRFLTAPNLRNQAMSTISMTVRAIIVASTGREECGTMIWAGCLNQHARCALPSSEFGLSFHHETLI